MHHHRRKSGHGQANTSMTDVRRAAVTASEPPAKHRRPGMTRRQTPVSSQKLGRSHRERERELEYRDSWHDERESFPQFCMTCEKQFVPFDEKILYCSETCRRIDQQSSATASSQMRNHAIGSGQALYPGGHQEPRDIVPRASPSRPNSMYFAHSPPASPGTTTSSHHTSALAALRSLTLGPSSPPSPPSSNNGGSLWRLSRSMATSPGNSYSKPSTAYLSSTYGNGYSYGYGYDSSSSTGADHPLPTRHPGYSRPKSIELVTPVHGR